MAAIEEAKPAEPTTLTIGGLKVYIHGLSTTDKGETPQTVLFLLHGRSGSHADFDPLIAKLDLAKINGRNKPKRQLLICTFDLRNHGDRVLDPKANLTWKEGNITHAQDMYSIISGTAKDVSMVIDFLPGYLYPYFEAGVLDWGVLGVSLGGHAAWYCLAHEDRLKWGCSVIGCPSYIALMEHRLGESGGPVRAEAPFLPDSFKRVLGRYDPGMINRVKQKIPPQLLQKRILVLSGNDDKLVSWNASKKFINAFQTKLEEGEKGRIQLKNNQTPGKLEVHTYDGVGHEFTDEMKREFYEWILQFI